MPLRIKANNDTAIEDYILSCSRIPLSCNRNRNGEHIIGEFRMVVSEKCPLSLRRERATLDVYPFSSSYAQFMGMIEKADYIEDSRTYRLTIRSNLSKLLNKKISVANLDVRFKNGTGIEYNGNDEWGYSSVQVLYVIEQMFIDVGISNFNFHSTFKDKEVAAIIYGGTERSIEFEHLRIDPEIFWNINQSIAAHRNEISSNQYASGFVNYWDFINNFLAIFNCHIYLSASSTLNEYRIADIATFPPAPIDDNNIFSSSIKKTKSKQQGWNSNHRFDNDRSHYRAYGTNYSLSSHEFTGGEKGTPIPVFSNLIYFYHRWWNPDYNVIWGGNDDGGAYNNGYCVDGYKMAYRYQKAVESNWSALIRKSPLAIKVSQFRTNNIIVKDQIIETVYET